MFVDVCCFVWWCRTCVLGSWDNNVYIYSVNYGRGLHSRHPNTSTHIKHQAKNTQHTRTHTHSGEQPLSARRCGVVCEFARQIPRVWLVGHLSQGVCLRTRWGCCVVVHRRVFVCCYV